jgi:hypothetical protein
MMPSRKTLLQTRPETIGPKTLSGTASNQVVSFSAEHHSISEAAAAKNVQIEARIARLQEELAEVTLACAKASREVAPGSLFFLLRKKWKLMQELFEAENERRLRRQQ